MKSFDLYEPSTIPEAIGSAHKIGNKASACGCRDLVAGVMKDWVQGEGMPLPDALVDLSRSIEGIKVRDKERRFGAMTTLSEIVESKELDKGFPLLTRAA